MGLRLRVLDSVTQLAAIEDAWQKLLDKMPASSLFQGPRWLLPWWSAYQRQLGAELYVQTFYDGAVLVGFVPLYRRVAKRSPGLRVKEIRLMGDAGPRPPSLVLTAAPGYEEDVGKLLGKELAGASESWDVLDLEPLREPGRIRAFMAESLSGAGRRVDASSAGGARRIQLAASSTEAAMEGSETDARSRVYQGDANQLRKGLAALRRLSRLEWADRDEASPLCDHEATRLLEDFVLPLGESGQVRLARRDDGDGEARAAALIVDDRDTAVVLALAVDGLRPRSGMELLEFEAKAASARGLNCLELGPHASVGQLPQLPRTDVTTLRMRAYGSSSSAKLARTYGKVRRRVEAARDAPGAAAAGARAAWSKIRTAAANVTGVQKMHLYRGELWTRGIKGPEALKLSRFTLEDWESTDSKRREEFMECLNLNVKGCLSDWKRGDLAVLATLGSRPAGIAWAALSSPVPIPELGRDISLNGGEAYIHDVYVAPQARGNALAALMLEHLATVLRSEDIYRGWAIIDSENIASVRAFEKAAYTAVADIMKTTKSTKDQLSIRPPDPEAKKLLGMTPS